MQGIKQRMKQWAPLLSRFLKSADDQVEMLLTLEEYCAEDEVFKVRRCRLKPAETRVESELGS